MTKQTTITTDTGLVVSVGKRGLAVRLDLERSEILAGEETADGPTLDATRREVMREVRDLVDAHGARDAEIYAQPCHGGHVVEIVERSGL